MDKDSAIAKVVKLLRLAKSDNPHEAASALRQAQKLMAEHGVSELDVTLASVREQRTTTGSRAAMPATYLHALAREIANAFGCDRYLTVTNGVTQLTFVGIAPNQQVAVYSFDVLRRQVMAARADFRRRKTRGKPGGRSQRADAYALGWVMAATEEIRRFAGELPTVVQTYMTEHHSDLVTGKTRATKLSDHAAAGFLDGAQARLRHGVDQASGPRRIGRQG